MVNKKGRVRRGEGTGVCRISKADLRFYKDYALRNNISLAQAVKEVTAYAKKSSFGFLR